MRSQEVQAPLASERNKHIAPWLLPQLNPGFQKLELQVGSILLNPCVLNDCRNASALLFGEFVRRLGKAVQRALSRMVLELRWGSPTFVHRCV